MVNPVNNREKTDALHFERIDRRAQIDSVRRFCILDTFPYVWSVFLFSNDKL